MTEFQQLRSDISVHSDGRGTVITARIQPTSRLNVFGIATIE